MTTVIIMYALTFAELGIVFFMGLFLMATSKEPINFLPTLSIGFAATSLMHISLLLVQLFNFSKKK
ncbi:protein rexB [Salmonella enterica subsp. enterica serovar Paratyphi A]|nr:protein rexB [Salmonella enterica subsp. enterica serovar Paratyphi A]CDV27696.1 protein rexB [Salmonella enterica subsp. enterica serovar Paratyphi A]CEB68506.1 protein rexB [Salmonella enterica subsp. enterica serovar Paratyphi A]CEC08542.1 protein rexB [Salmonella enterica subsp. enterica serovar Paratyphi A]CEC82669.1 protein rexB [Salmonella enterica subsp. enterica serovar Paratyphi A]